MFVLISRLLISNFIIYLSVILEYANAFLFIHSYFVQLRHFFFEFVYQLIQFLIFNVSYSAPLQCPIQFLSYVSSLHLAIHYLLPCAVIHSHIFIINANLFETFSNFPEAIIPSTFVLFLCEARFTCPPSASTPRNCERACQAKAMDKIVRFMQDANDVKTLQLCTHIIVVLTKSPRYSVRLPSF